MITASAIAVILTMAAGAAGDSLHAPPPYRFLAAAESEDQVALIEFTPCPAAGGAACGAKVVRTYEVGVFPTDIDGPHGVVASPDGKSFYLSIAHGRPTGYVQRYDVATGNLMEQIDVGMFPATIDIGRSGTDLFAINFNFEDPEMQPSSLSAMSTDPLQELARVTTCRMPHGSRLNPQGTRHYSGCMMDDQLVEIDVQRLVVSRRLNLVTGEPVTQAAAMAMGAMPAGHESMRDMSHGAEQSSAPSNKCSPTWAQPSVDGKVVYVACNRSNEIVAVDVASWKIVRRWATPKGPYNLAVSPDGQYIAATQKVAGSTAIWRLADASLVAEVPGLRKVASGLVITPDSRFVAVTDEGIGGEPGTVEIIELATGKRQATVDIGKQAGGIAVLP